MCSDQFVDVGSLVCSEKRDNADGAAVKGRICEDCLDLLQNGLRLGVVDVSLPESASYIHINERRIKALVCMGYAQWHNIILIELTVRKLNDGRDTAKVFLQHD